MHRRPIARTRAWSGAVVVVAGLLGACFGGRGGGGSGDGDPEVATCRTRPVAHCQATGDDTCHEFYSDLAADEARSPCESLGRIFADGPCGAAYDRCCILMDGSNDLPEGICQSPADDDYGTWESYCLEVPEDTFCAR